MSLNSKHPLYEKFSPDWELMADTYEGERKVKEEGVKYLPPTAGMLLDGMGASDDGYKSYQAYKLRAVFHDYVKEGVEALIGLMWQKPPTIELPESMEPIRENATTNGESLEILLRRINEQQLVTGRIGLLADLPRDAEPNTLPYVALYVAQSVVNWDDSSDQRSTNSLNLVVLDESGFVRTHDFTWEKKSKYRVLQLGDLDENEPEGTVKYFQGVFTDETFNPEAMKMPMYMGKPLEQIPFVFINSKDIIASPDYPPLIGLGRLTMVIYRGEADYRQNLYMQGQDTLVTIGSIVNLDSVDDSLRTGAGSRISMDLNGDAKYISVGSEGLSEQKEALDTDKGRAETKAGQLIKGSGSEQESGAALRTRLAAQTATLNQIALTGAAGLQHLLRTMATWIGANPEEVNVRANLEFSDFEIGGREFVDLMTARTMGLPLSLQSVHALMVERGLTKLDYDTEISTIEEEVAEVIPVTTPRAPTQSSQNNPDDDDENEGNRGPGSGS